jgi:hypothetical protein
MAKKVVLDVLIDALDMQSDEVTAYLDSALPHNAMEARYARMWGVSRSC